MSEFGEAVGTAIEGGLVSKAVSRGGSGTRISDVPLDRGHFAEGDCLNCGTPLVGAHCHACGQKAHLHRTLSAFMHDVAHGAVHFDSKTWRTLPLLAFKPGELTRRYIAGERTRFVSPMALFLFSIFLMFASFQFAGISTPTEVQTDTAGQIRMVAREEVERLQERRAELARQLEAENLPAAERAALERELRSRDDELNGIRAAEDQIPFLKDIISTSDEVPEGEGDAAGAQVESGRSNTEPTIRAALPTGEDGASTGVKWIDAGLKKWRSNPGLMLYKLQTNFYKFSWLLIPLSVPFVWLLFAWKRRFRAYDHAIFVTYSLSFMTLLILGVTMGGVAGLGGGTIAAILLLVSPLHMYKQLRGAYDLSRFSAIWRLAVLTGFIIIVLVLFLQLLLLIGVL